MLYVHALFNTFFNALTITVLAVQWGQHSMLTVNLLAKLPYTGPNYESSLTFTTHRPLTESLVKNLLTFLRLRSMGSGKGPSIWLMYRIWSYSEAPGKRGQPRNSSASTQPSDHMSIASPYGSPRMISGALWVCRSVWVWGEMGEISHALKSGSITVLHTLETRVVN